MFRVTDVFQSIAHLVREPESREGTARSSRPAAFVPDDDLGALMPVYSEIARRLSRSTYTRHTAA